MSALEPALLNQRLLIVGRSGFGKTNVAKGSGVEPLLQAKRRVGIFDPTDSWFGLRTKPDGKTPAFKVVIFGGEHGDLPLNPNAGAMMGRALAKAPDSWIISLSEMKTEADRERFAVEFFEALYDTNRAPLHLVVDEAETFAPQNAESPRQNIMTARLNQIVKRGRKRGFVTWLITQRPADLSKKVSSQADAVVAMSLTLPHDKRAVEAYIKDHDEDGTAAEMFKAMPKLPRGEGIVWWPGGDMLKRQRFPLSKTFDSGKTPEPGDVAIRLQPLKVDALAKAMEAVVKEAELNDPQKLKLKIADLTRDLDNALRDKKSGASADDLRQARAASYASGLYEGYSEGLRVFAPVLAAFSDAHGRLEQVTTKTKARAEELRLATNGVPAKHIAAAGVATPDHARRISMTQARVPTVRDGSGLADNATPGGTLAKGPHALLKVLAQYHGEPLDAVRLGMIAGYSSSGGTFQVYMRSLKASGYAVNEGGGWIITADGAAVVGPFERLPTGAALLAHWIERLDKGPAAILKAVADAGGSLSKEEAGERTGYAANGGTFQVYVRKLRALKLISGTTTLELQDDLR